jgi:hypothetical protein
VRRIGICLFVLLAVACPTPARQPRPRARGEYAEGARGPRVEADTPRVAAAPQTAGAAGQADGGEPSKFAAATLEETLKFLKKELNRNAGTRSYGGQVERFEVVDFSSCKIRYRVAPVVALAAPYGSAPSPTAAGGSGFVPPTNDYYVNLADLDEASIGVPKGEKDSIIYFSTRNREPKIRHSRKSNSTGRVAVDYKDSMTGAGYFILRRTDAAPQIRHALIRAIQLCQGPKP